jgi:hypothetical protein
MHDNDCRVRPGTQILKQAALAKIHAKRCFWPEWVRGSIAGAQGSNSPIEVIASQAQAFYD